MKPAHKIAILGFGVVGSGVARLLAENSKEIEGYLGRSIEIARILDLRDFPDSPLSHLVTHDFADILADEEIETVVEVMGGSHPAYEYTLASLAAGKNVVTSNKEVVSAFGDEFVRLAAQNGVSYRFEASVGGGIPVIEPLTSCIRQNKIKEIRGILNGTTNYILTKMFTFGSSFEKALADAQRHGYAESNPDADILGTDACRKIAILTALGMDVLPSVDNIPTEGITSIRQKDVLRAEKIQHSIKLLGRCISTDVGLQVCVAPFLIPLDSPLSRVDGVYNAIEIVAEPLSNVMFYGRGAGAGATASAVVGDLIPIIAGGGFNPILPGFNKTDFDPIATFESFTSKSYVSIPKEYRGRAEDCFGKVEFLDEGDECAFITEPMTEARMRECIEALGVSPLSRIRFCD